jgi:hypothetical protein
LLLVRSEKRKEDGIKNKNLVAGLSVTIIEKTESVDGHFSSGLLVHFGILLDLVREKRLGKNAFDSVRKNKEVQEVISTTRVSFRLGFSKVGQYDSTD